MSSEERMVWSLEVGMRWTTRMFRLGFGALEMHVVSTSECHMLATGV